MAILLSPTWSLQGFVVRRFVTQGLGFRHLGSRHRRQHLDPVIFTIIVITTSSSHLITTSLRPSFALLPSCVAWRQRYP
jgi:hypothetical protein